MIAYKTVDFVKSRSFENSMSLGDIKIKLD